MTGESRSAAARRFERRLNRRLDLKVAASRAWGSVPAIVQIVTAATISYAFAHYVLRHDAPLVAVTVTISVLGFARDASPRRVLDSVIGILVGIALSEVLLMLLGSGIWQLAAVLFLTLMIARLLSPSAAFAIAAGVQAMLVLLLPAPDGGVFVRSLDGVVGGVVALLITALIPRDPRRLAANDARRLVSVLAESLDSVAVALREAHEPAAVLALDRLRRTQQLLDNWAASLQSAMAISRLSPMLRRHLPAMRHQQRVLAGLDLLTRHLRVVVRRISFLVKDGEPRPFMADMIDQVAAGVAVLGASLQDPARAHEARQIFVAMAPTLDPSLSLPEMRVPESVVIHLMRPLLIDLLVATGMLEEEARALLPPA
ncbi:MAG: hypothetical protein JWP30_903 [Homoserinimonas sp.]|jgi:uncharacterized membrane protein YgaE (UPF0421/DUF939 family)|nr:hypothetical protein [Homoserinimonas sp.]